MIDLSDSHKIVEAKINIGDNTYTLIERPEGNSGKVRCHFYYFSSPDSKFTITLRLDWDELDENGDPCLDADIKEGRKEYKVGWKQWHHTSKSLVNGEYLYIWRPENKKLLDCSIEFKLQSTHEQLIRGMARIAPPINKDTKKHN